MRHAYKRLYRRWQQTPKSKGQGHYSHRLLFHPDGQYLYISSGIGKKIQRKTWRWIWVKSSEYILTARCQQTIHLQIMAMILPLSSGRQATVMYWNYGVRWWWQGMGERNGCEAAMSLIWSKKAIIMAYQWFLTGVIIQGIDIPDHDTNPVSSSAQDYVDTCHIHLHRWASILWVQRTFPACGQYAD